MTSLSELESRHPTASARYGEGAANIINLVYDWEGAVCQSNRVWLRPLSGDELQRQVQRDARQWYHGYAWGFRNALTRLGFDPHLLARFEPSPKAPPTEDLTHAAELEQEAARGMEREHVEDDEAARIALGHHKMTLHNDGSISEVWRADDEAARKADAEAFREGEDEANLAEVIS